MCSTFILSMSVAIAAQIEGRDPIIDGFGVVAMIALTPILSTLVLGYIYKRKDEKDRIEKERLQKLGKQMKDLVALNLHMIVTIVDGGMGEDVIDFSKKQVQQAERSYMEEVLVYMIQGNF